ncbi:hypothetical protein [Petrocella sp. FN5]|uniref:hypothetical protein n=1 Tax=Petrocella sp. FN5 TaxID=3032002 RepID=UPI0023DBE27F|nr:hypothetical protein [Petrocella sp. FN5]MDF1615953.1 hypothetical protein [Petrocella sp. FN5]
MKKKISIIIGLLCMVIMVTWIVGISTEAGSTEPGTVNDPLVTKSYVDQKSNEIMTTLLAKINPTGSTDESEKIDMKAVYAYIDQQIAGQSGNSFIVVEAEVGDTILCGGGTELILRAGKATVIQGENGDGLADLTQGVDLKGGAFVPMQHHLLISRDDGRGIKITEKAFVMIKGAYTLK